MKFWKHTLVSALAFFGICTMVVYSACDRDACLHLKCKNDAPCVNGFCQCPTGYEGAECQLWISERYVGHYSGISQCNGQPAFTDAAQIEVVDRPNVISFKRSSAPDVKFTGAIINDKVVVNDEANQRSMILTLDQNKKITVHIEETVDGKKNICSFVGTKP